MRPIPTTTAPAPSVSARIPASLRSSTTRSFGHLRPASKPATSRDRLGRGDPGGQRHEVQALGAQSGPEQHRHEERRAGRRRPLRPWRPRPAVCTSRDGHDPVAGAPGGLGEEVPIRRVDRDEPADLDRSGFPRAASTSSGAGLQVASASGIDRRIRRREAELEGREVLSKILIANRGEIAIRVMRTCRELGIATVAVYSDLDRDAAHVRYADEAYALGGQTAAESYLNTARHHRGDRAVGRRRGAPRLRLLLARTPTSRARSSAAGVTWIGPPPEAIEIMGDKISSRLAAERAGVASVPGTTTPITDPREIVEFGEQFGYPIAIKAAYGGGGRGMKVVEAAAEAQSAFESAQREAQAYFGRAECYMERYLTRPRHVEVQVFTDSHGNGVYLERPRLLRATPPPEADRRGTRAGHRRRDPPRDGRGRGEGRARVRLRERGHRRDAVPGRRVLLPRDEHPPAGRALRHRGDHRPRSRRRADPRRVGRAALVHAVRRSSTTATRSSAGSTPRTPRATSCRRPARSRGCACLRARACVGTAATTRATRSRSTTTTSSAS